jgi:hypothetical protein
VTPAVDYALTRPDADGDHLALIGMSLGGYWAARSVAFEHRFRAAVFFDGVYDFYQAVRGLVAKEAIAVLDAGDAVTFEEIVYKLMQNNTALRWLVTQGVWTFGVSSFTEFVTKSKQYNGWHRRADSVSVPRSGSRWGHVFPRPAAANLDALQVPKDIVRFTAADGAENHCQSGALSYKDEVVFNWLDETMKLHDGRKG